MEKKFRALRTVALLYKIFAWIVLVIGGVSGIFMVILGAVQERVGFQSPLIAGIPGLARVGSFLPGLVGGLLTILLAVIQFIFIYAISELIHLLLAIERNTRDTAFYLHGESTLPPSSSDVSWDTPAENSLEES